MAAPYVPPVPGVMPSPFAAMHSDMGVADLMAKFNAMKSFKLAAMDAGTYAVPDDSVASYMAPDPWGSDNTCRVSATNTEDATIPDVDRTRREHPTVPEPVELEVYDYQVSCESTMVEADTPVVRARQNALRGATRSLRALGDTRANASTLYGDGAFEASNLQLAGAFTKLGSALDLVRGGGTIVGPVAPEPTVAIVSFRDYRHDNMQHLLPVYVPNGVQDNVLSALGYLLLRDTYRYVRADGRSLVRDTMRYPCGACGLLFVFDAGAPRPVDVGGGAVTGAGLTGLLTLLAGRGFGSLLYSAVNSGAMLNLCYGEPEDLDGLDHGALIRAEPRSDYRTVAGRRIQYGVPAAAPAVCRGGEYLALPFCNEVMLFPAVQKLDSYFRPLVLAADVDADPLAGDGIRAVVVPTGGVGVWGGLTIVPNGRGHEVVIAAEHWRDGIMLSPVVPDIVANMSHEWLMLCHYYGVLFEDGEGPELSNVYDRPQNATHTLGRLAHSQDVSAGYLVPQYDPAHLAMLVANLYVGSYASVAGSPTPVYYTDAEHAARARKAYRQEHSVFVYSMADRGVKPEDLECVTAVAGMHAAQNFSGLRAMVLPPIAPGAWGNRAQFECYELGNYDPFTPVSPFRGMSREVHWKYTGEATFDDTAEGRRALDALLRNIYSRGGSVELSRQAAKQHRIFRYCEAAAAGARGPRYPFFTGGAAFSHFRRGTTKYTAAFSGSDAAGVADGILRQQRLTRDSSIMLWC